ncbi:hypothetical protein QTP88_007185 [Uroleucon formosanum]
MSISYKVIIKKYDLPVWEFILRARYCNATLLRLMVVQTHEISPKASIKNKPIVEPEISNSFISLKNYVVGKTAANSCIAAIRFFDFIQNLYVFFTATPILYSLLTKKIASIDKNKRVYILMNLNETRWSCRTDATKAVLFVYDYIKEALVEISNDLDQKDIVKIESKKLYE